MFKLIVVAQLTIALAKSSTRFPNMPAVCRTRPHSFCWHAFSYSPFNNVRTVTTRPASNIPSDVEKFSDLSIALVLIARKSQ